MSPSLVPAPPSHRRITRSTSKIRNFHNSDRTTTVPAQVYKSGNAPRSIARRTNSAAYVKTISTHRTPPIHAQHFHIIQEKVAYNLYELLVAAALWNRTKGIHARPVFLALVLRYPSPEHLAKASESDLAQLIRPLGLQNVRARRLLSFAQEWVQNPPTKHRRYRKLHYPVRGSGRDVGAKEVLTKDDPREGWEVAHLPGIGPYALDSFRIFHRDMLRGLATDWEGTGASLGFEPEWKRVVPFDKELKAYICWMWLKEGWIWDPASGERVAASIETIERERVRSRSLSPKHL